MGNHPSNHREVDVEAQLDELHEQHGDRDDALEIGAYSAGVVAFIVLAWWVFDWRGVILALIICATVVVWLRAKTALVVIMAAVSGIVAFVVVHHILYQVLGS